MLAPAVFKSLFVCLQYFCCSRRYLKLNSKTLSPSSNILFISDLGGHDCLGKCCFCLKSVGRRTWCPFLWWYDVFVSLSAVKKWEPGWFCYCCYAFSLQRAGRRVTDLTEFLFIIRHRAIEPVSKTGALLARKNLLFSYTSRKYTRMLAV